MLCYLHGAFLEGCTCLSPMGIPYKPRATEQDLIIQQGFGHPQQSGGQACIRDFPKMSLRQRFQNSVGQSTGEHKSLFQVVSMRPLEPTVQGNDPGGPGGHT